MKHLFAFAILLLSAFACRHILPPAEVQPLSKEISQHCQKSDLNKMAWLIGSWQTSDGLIQVDIQMPNDSTLSVHRTIRPENSDEMSLIQWNGRQFTVNANQAVTWIGRKSIRIESFQTDIAAHTWTRKDDNSWYMITHHADQPASQILFEKMPEAGINP